MRSRYLLSAPVNHDEREGIFDENQKFQPEHVTMISLLKNAP
jgi:hypothetical protein